jgi:hypothetical protein
MEENICVSHKALANAWSSDCLARLLLLLLLPPPSPLPKPLRLSLPKVLWLLSLL